MKSFCHYLVVTLTAVCTGVFVSSCGDDAVEGSAVTGVATPAVKAQDVKDNVDNGVSSSDATGSDLSARRSGRRRVKNEPQDVEVTRTGDAKGNTLPPWFREKKISPRSAERIAEMRALAKSKETQPKALEKAQKMLVHGNKAESEAALKTIREIGGRNGIMTLANAIEEVSQQQQQQRRNGGAGIVDGTTDSKASGTETGTGTENDPDVYVEVLSKAPVELRNMIEESYFSGQEHLEYAEWQTVLNQVDEGAELKAYMSLLSIFPVEESGPILVSVWDNGTPAQREQAKATLERISGGQKFGSSSDAAAWVNSKVQTN